MSIVSALVTPRTNRPALLSRALTAGALAVRSAFAPETLFTPETPVSEPVSVTPEPVETAVSSTPEPVELPSVEAIEEAAEAYSNAAALARRADRVKRSAKKTLEALPLGTYGGWLISRKASTRQTPDLVKIAAIFEQQGLGPVPMRSVADSLVVTRVDAEAVAA